MISLVAALVFAGYNLAQADGLGLKNWTTDGSIEINGQSATNEVDAFDGANDHRGGTVTRIALGIGMDVTSGVKGKVLFLRNSQTLPGNAQYGDGITSVNAEEAGICLDNAYIDIDNMLTMDTFRIGRQYGGRPGDTLVYFDRYNDDSLTTNSLDALSVSKKVGLVDLSFVTGKVNEDDVIANADNDDALGDVNVSWLIAKTDKVVPNLPLEIGIYQGTDSNGPAAGDNCNLVIYDLRAGYSLMGDAVKLCAEYAMNQGGMNGAGIGGAEMKFKGNALVLKAKYENKDLGFGGHLKYMNASGDDQNSANNDDKSFHDYSQLGWNVSDLRYGEILSNSNALAVGGVGASVGLDTGLNGTGLNVINLGGDYTLPVMDKKVSLALDYFVSQVNEVANGIDDGVGTEIDLSANYKHSETVSAKVGYATFSPEKGYVNGYAANANLPTDDVTKLFAKLCVKWGMDSK